MLLHTGLPDASCCPCLGREHKRRRWQRLPATFAELRLLRRVESSRVTASRTHAEGKRLPPIVKARMLEADCEDCLLDLPQPGGMEQPRKVALAGAGTLRLILDLGIELARHIPEQTERGLTAGVIPYARRNDTAWANDAHHFAQPLPGICHEVNDQLRESSVEGLVRKRQLLRRHRSHVDARVTVPRRREEGLGRINSRNQVCSQPPCQFGGKRTWTTADVEHSLTGRYPREIDKLRREQHRVPAHEAVIRISRAEEAHSSESSACRRRQ